VPSWFVVILLLGLAGRVLSADSCATLPPGAVSWWQAESNALDFLDGNHGVLSGNATYGAGSKGTGFVLDGNRDGVLVGNATNLQLQDFSIEGWIKRTSATTISFNGNGGAQVFALGAGGGGFGFYLRPDAYLALGKLQVNETASSVRITDTNWHHVAVTKQGTTVVFYADGLAYPAPAYNSGGFSYSGPGYIGAWRNPSGLVDNSFYGTIDELAMYNRSLTAAEIQTIFIANNRGKCPPAPPCAVPVSGLVSWWRAETNTLDVVDGNHGVLAGNATYGAGRVGSGFVFDGDRDGVQVGTGTNLQLQDFTVEAWIKRSSATLASFNGNGNGELFVVGTNPGGWGLRINQADNRLVLGKSGGAQSSSAAQITDTNWHHVAVTKRGTAVVFYVDGVAFPAPPFDPGPFTFSAPAYIGAWFNPFGQVDNSFYGVIDELAVYNRDLSAPEILAIYQADSSGKCPPLLPPPQDVCVAVPTGAVSWWRASGNAVDVLDGNHGTLAGNATYGEGRTGSGFRLDGNRDGVLIGSATNLQLQDFSIEGWIKRSSSSAASFNGNGNGTLFALGGGGGGYGFWIQQSDSRLTLGKSQVNQVVSAAVVADTSWHHVAVTKQGTVVVFYVDGQAYPAPTYNSGGYNFAAPGYIGAWLNPSGLVDNSFYGTIDELGIYDRALTAAEIGAIHGAITLGKCPPPNRPPLAQSKAISLAEDSSRAISLTGFDPDGDTLEYLIVSGPTNGTLSGIGPDLIYVPTPNFFGLDSFRFRVSDGQTSSSPAIVSINVFPVNDIPVAQSQSVAIDEDTPLAIMLGATDADGDILTYTLTAPAHGSLTGTPPNLIYHPDLNYFGPDDFTFDVSDAETNSNTATISINVRSVNDAPIARIAISPLTQVLGITNKVVVAGVCADAAVILDGSGSSDVEHDPLTYEWMEGTNSLGSTAIVTNQFVVGTHEITLTVNDGALDGVANEIVDVVSPAQGLGIIIACLDDSELTRGNVRPLIASLMVAAASFDDCRTIPGINQLKAFQHKVRAQVAPGNPDLAARLIEAAQQIIDAVQTAP